jgi:hypothetical protein
MTRGNPIDFSAFRSSVDDPRLRPDPYVLRELSRKLEGFANLAESAQIPANFSGRIRAAIYDGFRRLDSLPRDDPFWQGTNRRPTLSKLPDFCAKLLERDPGDARALWTMAADELITWVGFNPNTWRRLIALEGLDASWPIYAALFFWGLGSLNGLVPLLDSAGLCKSAKPTLEHLVRSGAHFTREWAMRVGAGCGIDLTPTT